MKKFSKGGVGMFAIKEFFKLFLIAVISLFVQIIPAYAAIQTESIHKIDSVIEPITTEERLIETIHAPPKIVLSVENDFTVETFYPEEISYDNIETNYIEETIDTPENLSPRITMTIEDDIMVETFYPADNEIKNLESEVTPPRFQDYDDSPPRATIISLSLDGTNDVQYFSRNDSNLASLNFVVGKSSLSDGIIFCAEFTQYL